MSDADQPAGEVPVPSVGTEASPSAPLMAIPLEYAATDLDRPIPVALRMIILLAWLCVAVTPPLMLSISTEVIILSGMAEATLAVVALIFGGRRRALWIVGLGTAHLSLALAVFVVINVRDWSPREARAPVLAIACIAAALFALPTWIVFRSDRR